MRAEMARLQAFSDRLAVFLSGLCVLHCLFLPILLILAPVLGLNLVSDELVHSILFIIAIPVSLVGLGLGYRRHRHLGSAALAAMGLVLMYVALLQNSLFMEEALTIIGVSLVAFAHIQNRRRLAPVAI